MKIRIKDNLMLATGSVVIFLAGTLHYITGGPLAKGVFIIGLALTLFSMRITSSCNNEK